MSSRIPWYVVSLLLVGCGTILWFFWDQIKKRRRQNKKEIFISADCWLEVFALLQTSQLGLEIALISRRFDRRVDEHFKTRKWKLGKEFWIRKKKRWNGANEMEIVNANGGKALQIPQIPLPNKVFGFKQIKIIYFDHNVLTFLGHFHRFFASATTNTYLDIMNENVRSLEFFLSTIWPLLRYSIRLLYLSKLAFRRLRQLAPSILNDCPSLQVFYAIDNVFPEFPPDDSANASDGQAVAKWLFTPSPDDVLKVLKYTTMHSQWPSIIEQFKTAFSAASSRVCFSIFFEVVPSSSTDLVVPFDLTNALTGEKLALSKRGEERFVLNRIPIAPDERDRKWDEWLLMNNQQWNQIYISIGKDGIDNGLLDASHGPSGQQQNEVNE